MIQAHGYKPTPVNHRLAPDVEKVFAEAGGEVDAVVPGLEDHFAGLAEDFLLQWNQEKPGVSDTIAPKSEESGAPQVVSEEPKSDVPEPAQNGQMTTFFLNQDWNLS